MDTIELALVDEDTVPEKTPTFEALKAWVLATLPWASFEQDEDGQIIVWSGLWPRDLVTRIPEE